MNRREFLKRLGIGVASLPIVASVPKTAAVEAIEGAVELTELEPLAVAPLYTTTSTSYLPVTRIDDDGIMQFEWEAVEMHFTPDGTSDAGWLMTAYPNGSHTITYLKA